MLNDNHVFLVFLCKQKRGHKELGSGKYIENKPIWHKGYRIIFV